MTARDLILSLQVGRRSIVPLFNPFSGGGDGAGGDGMDGHAYTPAAARRLATLQAAAARGEI